MKKLECPLCQKEGSKALLGLFPIKLCLDERCGCAWGIWIDIAFPLASILQPTLGGWLMLLYKGSCLKALWHSLKSEAANG